MLVSAAAGSGKTAVLSERCARLVCDAGGCGVENLLVLTFTDAAANEMKTRIAGAIQARLGAARPVDRRRLFRQAAMIDRARSAPLTPFAPASSASIFTKRKLIPPSRSSMKTRPASCA